jgi:hypothetical protein
MILIFDIFGGFTDMLKDILSINKFTCMHKIYFTIRNASFRSMDNLAEYRYYSVEELFHNSTFTSNPYYINFNELSNKINDNNSYNFCSDKIEGNLWSWDKRQYLNDIYSNILHHFNISGKEYIIVGGSFWYYSNLENIYERVELIKQIKPSNKILIEYLKNKEVLPELYNLIHYRYESDWIPNLKMGKTPYIVPPIDELIQHIPFKNNYKIYICCSNIEKLKEQGLMYNELHTYNNILTKIPNNLSFDENGFLDLLIGLNCQEFYGNSISGFTHNLNVIKQTNNNYNCMEIFQKYNII